jgi:hypothetical protein
VTGQLSLFKGKRQRGVKPPPALEFKTHCMVADALRIGAMPGWQWTHFPAGEARPSFVDKKGRRVSPAADRLKRMGLMPGWPDFVLVSPAGRFFGLELKRGKAPLTDDQEAFRKWCGAHLVPYVVARSFDDAIRALAGWGAIRVRL